MRPPATRPLRVTISASLAARMVIVDLAALAVSALAVHATLAAAGDTGTALSIAGHAVRPLVWPAAHFPGLRGRPVLADLLTVVLTLLVSAVVVGVIAGYAAEAGQHRGGRHERV